MTPALFFDRDGTLMRDAHYCSDPKDVAVFPGVADALRRAQAAGYRIVVVTNQSGIGRGLYTEDAYHRVHAELVRQLGGEGIIDGSYYCPAHPETPSARRKPMPGMLTEAASQLGLDLAASWMIGDKEIDVLAGRAAGARTILVRTGYGLKHEAATTADHVAEDAVAAVDYVLAQTNPS